MKTYVRPSVVAVGSGSNHSLSKGCPKMNAGMCGILFRN